MAAGARVDTRRGPRTWREPPTRARAAGPWEASAGYARAIAVGDECFVSGTTDAGPDGESLHPGDAAAQARAAFAIVEGALGEAGFSLDDVVRTRMYIVDPADADAVARVHGELFTHVRPAATLVVVARLIREPAGRGRGRGPQGLTALRCAGPDADSRSGDPQHRDEHDRRRAGRGTGSGATTRSPMHTSTPSELESR